MPKRENIWLTPKENFIKKIEAYLDEKFNDFTTQRISRLLDEYSEETDIFRRKNAKNYIDYSKDLNK
jgi:hypothetical protein